MQWKKYRQHIGVLAATLLVVGGAQRVGYGGRFQQSVGRRFVDH